MIYKVAGFALLAADAVNADRFRLTADTTGTGSRTALDIDEIRGASHIVTASSATPTVSVLMTQSTNGVPGVSTTFGALAEPVSAWTAFGQDVAYGGDHVTGNMLFASGGVAALNQQHVAYMRGSYTHWSLAQVLSPPAEFSVQNFFGNAMDLDRYHLRQLAVGCYGCNASHVDSGAVFIYEPTSPDASKWSQTASLSPPSWRSSLGRYQISLHKNTLLASVASVAGQDSDNTLINTVVFQKGKDGWSYLQEFSLGADAISDDSTAAQVYDDTIVISGVADIGYVGGFYGKGTVRVFYPNTKEFSGPKWKPAPVQWSVQQVLISPLAAATTSSAASTADLEFGQTVSIDGDRMFIGENDNTAGYIYERQSTAGMWSVQQKLTLSAAASQSQVAGSHVAVLHTGGVDILDETQKWDCLVVSVEDHFNDGWDTANLVVDVPGGDKDTFTSRCDESNPFQFRYCPASCSDEGLYRFSVPGGRAAKFHWEQIWRVYEESTGNWFTGNWDTKMDFEWSCDKRQFAHKKVEHELPNNITCKTCKSKPTEKPSSRLRQLKSKDSTQSPTVSPAPTIQTSVTIEPWQQLTLKSSGSNDWFDSQHRGTSYYISTIDGKRLLSTGTMCPWEATITKSCWEDYPDGDYILRVGGALDRDSTHDFTYCNSVNDITQESQVVFRVSNGNCYIVSNVKSSFFCKNTVGVVQASVMEISLSGVGDAALTSVEYADISAAVANVLPGVSASDVKVVSAVSDGSGVSVVVEVFANSVGTGYDFTDAEAVEAWESSTLSIVQSSAGMQAIRNALTSEEHATALHTTTKVAVTRFYLSADHLTVHQDGPDMVTDFADATSVNTATKEESTSNASTEIVWASVAGYVLAAVGAIAFAAVVIARKTSVPVSEPVQALEMSDHSFAPADRKLTKEPPKLTLADMKELVAAEDSALATMLKNHQI